MREHNFSWKAFWGSKAEWSYLKLILDYVAVKFSRLAWEECGLCLVYAYCILAFGLQLRKKARKKPKSG